MVLRFILLSSLLFSCATTDLSDEVVGFAIDLELPECNHTLLVNKAPDNEWNDYDDSKIKPAREVCRNLFNSRGCLRKVVKWGDKLHLNYCRGLD